VSFYRLYVFCDSTDIDQYRRVDKRSGIDVDAWGQLQRIVVVNITSANVQALDLDEERKYFVAYIRRVNTSTDRDGLITYAQDGTLDIVDLAQVDRVVGRVRDRAQWSILDRNADLAEATFTSTDNIL
jgi:hypothetical protein